MSFIYPVFFEKLLIGILSDENSLSINEPWSLSIKARDAGFDKKSRKSPWYATLLNGDANWALDVFEFEEYSVSLA